MTLFRYLNDDAFLIFSRGHRHLYEQALLRVYDRYFAVGAQFPSPQEVVHAVYDLIGEQPALLSDDEGDAEEVLPEIVSSRRRRIKFTASSEAGDKALAMAQRVYNRLIDTGWLEEEEYGIKVTVDMPMGPLLVLQQLARLRSDIGKRFGGVVVLVKTSLEQVHHLGQQPTDKAKSDAAHALDNAVENANDFTKTLRAILSDLKRIRRSLLEATSLRDRFNTYFEQFIGELLLKDFSSILTSNHPYRHRDRILDLARNIYLDEPKLQVVTDGYQLAGIARGEAEARQMALANLHSIDSTFDTIGEMFERILQFRRGLETRLRNTIKYAEQGERGLAYRAENLIKRLETLAAKYPERYDLPLIRTALEKVDSPLGSRRLASPRQPRQPVVAEPLVVGPNMGRLDS